jgi:hypothetical protein
VRSADSVPFVRLQEQVDESVGGALGALNFMRRDRLRASAGIYVSERSASQFDRTAAAQLLNVSLQLRGLPAAVEPYMTDGSLRAHCYDFCQLACPLMCLIYVGCSTSLACLFCAIRFQSLSRLETRALSVREQSAQETYVHRLRSNLKAQVF